MTGQCTWRARTLRLQQSMYRAFLLQRMPTTSLFSHLRQIMAWMPDMEMQLFMLMISPSTISPVMYSLLIRRLHSRSLQDIQAAEGIHPTSMQLRTQLTLKASRQAQTHGHRQDLQCHRRFLMHLYLARLLRLSISPRQEICGS